MNDPESDSPVVAGLAPATLGGCEGRGYGVVESLSSLGKGRRLTGLFRASAALAEPLRFAVVGRRRTTFEGLVHFRHHSRRTTLDVEPVRIDEEGGDVLIEFVAHDVPYGLG
jgi:hypothetical protein